MDCRQLKGLWQQAFGDTEALIDGFFATAYAPERCRVMREGNRITAALYWLNTEYAGRKFAYIYGVATHSDYRGRGLCRKLMRKTHEQLLGEHYAGAILVPGTEGLRQMYAKMGYRNCTTLSRFSCKAGEKSVPVRRISVEEYALLRRAWLPQGGVIQEGENLAYLSTYGECYAGEDFVMAAELKAEELDVMELLGNRTQAPAIVKALGYETGTFRIPGEGFPFAMIYPLQEDTSIPTYFGLAFD